MQRESNMKLLIMYIFCMFYERISALRVSPTTRSRSYRGLALREVDRGLRSLRLATPSLRSVAASAVLVLIVLIM